MFMVAPLDADALAAGAPAEDAEEADDEEAAVGLALPWQAAAAARPPTDTTATTTRATARGQAEVITGSSLAGTSPCELGPPGP
jgi:hypothetical protein